MRGMFEVEGSGRAPRRQWRGIFGVAGKGMGGDREVERWWRWERWWR